MYPVDARRLTLRTPSRRASSAVRMATAGLVLAGCRAVLDIDEGRPTLPSEASVDSGVTADDAADGSADARFCESIVPRPTFCADFDVGELLSQWSPTATSGTNPHLLAGGTAEADVAQLRSPPRSARFASPAVTSAAATATAFAAVDLPGLPSFLLLETDVRIDTELFTADGGTVDLLELDLPGSGAIRVERGATGTRLVVADHVRGSQASATFALPLPVGDWVRFKLLFRNDPNGAAGDVTAYLGGPAAKVETPASFQRNLGKAPILRAGVVVARSPVGAFRLSIDNVRVSYDR